MSTALSAQHERAERWRHREEALARIPLQAGQRILDLGCGVGQMAARFHRLGARVIGVDGNAELIKAARAIRRFALSTWISESSRRPRSGPWMVYGRASSRRMSPDWNRRWRDGVSASFRADGWRSSRSTTCSDTSRCRHPSATRSMSSIRGREQPAATTSSVAIGWLARPSAPGSPSSTKARCRTTS
ncbi:MAG: methyltransferase domain-containing protein [Candidatus Rokubacteria bacterium]|nr:methyltransferase domain-containing protein [Candidatus Rokubacteria bacterium]